MRAQLAAGAASLGLSLSARTLDKLLAYQALLQKWSRVHNLTSIRDPEEMLTRHLLDSLAVIPHVRGERLLDVGSGAGLPGIVIAIALPDVSCTLLDSQGKKTRFLTQVAIELKLKNVEVVQARIEEFDPGTKFDCIISRAFAELSTFAELAKPLLATGGVLLAMKSIARTKKRDRMTGMCVCTTFRCRGSTQYGA
ncbi:MAG: 16S rRNA (guanine(527)-N(7))-methyltransferase RsmG [Gammaproteobacteria bacterium]